VWNGLLRLDYDALEIPISWKKPRKVFVNSMSDLFHDDVPGDFVSRVWSVMQRTPQHTYQILTKRPDRMRSVIVGEGSVPPHGYATPLMRFAERMPPAPETGATLASVIARGQTSED
jgi:protein gp37